MANEEMAYKYLSKYDINNGNSGGGGESVMAGWPGENENINGKSQ